MNRCCVAFMDSSTPTQLMHARTSNKASCSSLLSSLCRSPFVPRPQPKLIDHQVDLVPIKLRPVVVHEPTCMQHSAAQHMVRCATGLHHAPCAGGVCLPVSPLFSLKLRITHTKGRGQRAFRANTRDHTPAVDARRVATATTPAPFHSPPPQPTSHWGGCVRARTTPAFNVVSEILQGSGSYCVTELHTRSAAQPAGYRPKQL